MNKKLYNNISLVILIASDFLSGSASYIFAFNNQKFSDREWIFLNIDFLERHNFYTAFARKHFTTQKNENIKLLKSLI